MCFRLSKHTCRLALFLEKTQLFPLNIVCPKRGNSLLVLVGDIRPNNVARSRTPLLLVKVPGALKSTVLLPLTALRSILIATPQCVCLVWMSTWRIS